MSSQPNDSTNRTRKLRRFGMVLLALVVASFAFRLLGEFELEHTSLVFIGIPALLAWIVAAAAPPKTAYGSVMRTTTLALLISWIFLGEAFICVLMAAPIFYLVGACVAFFRAQRDGPGRSLTAVLLLPLALEGTHPMLSSSREREVIIDGVVPATVADVRARLAAPPRFDRELPLFLRLGFPTPNEPRGGGLAAGDRWVIPFAHGEHHPGELVLSITESTPNRVRFVAVRDDSYITHWLWWREAMVELTPAGDGHTYVRWTLRYARRLDPSSYFDPLEKYGVTLAAEYLLATLTTP